MILHKIKEWGINYSVTFCNKRKVSRGVANYHLSKVGGDLTVWLIYVENRKTFQLPCAGFWRFQKVQVFYTSPKRAFQYLPFGRVFQST